MSGYVANIAQRIDEPAARINSAGETPFLIIELAPGSRTTLTFDTPDEALAFAAELAAGANMLADAQAKARNEAAA